MNNIVLKVLQFFLLITVQIFLIDEIDIGNINYYFSPIIFGLFIISMNLNVEIWILMTLAFLMGFSIDIFRNTIGLNISALIVVSYSRNIILNMISPRDGFDPLKELNVNTMGLNRYLLYAGVLLFIQHFWFYIIEDFHFNQLHILFIKAIINSIIALGLIVLFQYLTLSKK